MMTQALETLKIEIIKSIISLNNDQWRKAEIIIQFPSFINKGLTILPSFWDNEGDRVRLFLNMDEPFQKHIYSFIAKYNQDTSYNQILLRTTKGDYKNAAIDISFNQEVENTFRNNLPKSWQKRVITPWWKNPEETKGLM
jgi:hypothetical protein